VIFIYFTERNFFPNYLKKLVMTFFILFAYHSVLKRFVWSIFFWWLSELGGPGATQSELGGPNWGPGAFFFITKGARAITRWPPPDPTVIRALLPTKLSYFQNHLSAFSKMTDIWFDAKHLGFRISKEAVALCFNFYT